MEQCDRAAFRESVKNAPRSTFILYYLLELSPIHLVPDPVRVGYCRKKLIGRLVAAARPSFVGADSARNWYPMPTTPAALQLVYEQAACNEQRQDCELAYDVGIHEGLYLLLAQPVPKLPRSIPAVNFLDSVRESCPSLPPGSLQCLRLLHA
jgi:hypothetical protein